MIEPAAPIDRDAMERARAQIAEAQAYKAELDLIYAAVKRTRDEMDALGADMLAGDRTARAGRELAAIVAGTEQATQAILQAAEEIDQAANTLSPPRSRASTTRASPTTSRIAWCRFSRPAIFRTSPASGSPMCSQTLAFVEEHVDAADGDLAAHRAVQAGRVRQRRWRARRFLNGPKLPDDRGHSTQDDIDGMFGCA